MTVTVSSPVGAAFQYQDDGIHEHQTRRVEIDSRDTELLSCHLCGSHLYADIGTPLHLGKDGHFYCDIGCELERRTLQAIADGADALIERVSTKEMTHA